MPRRAAARALLPPVADSAATHQRAMIEAACAPLYERIAELERDAARYRWLRDGDIASGICAFVGAEIVLCDEALDAAIDAARRAARPQPEPAVSSTATAGS